jgi:hypothetical protein
MIGLYQCCWMILPVAMHVPKRVVIGMHLILIECFCDGCDLVEM